jgi:hypothetical protein
MNKNAYRGHRFPPAIIQVTVWMYARFTLSLWTVPGSPVLILIAALLTQIVARQVIEQR